MKNNIFIYFTLFICCILSCSEENYYPKPTSYFRINLPEKSYKAIEEKCPFSFEIPIYSSLINKFNKSPDCHKTIKFTTLKAELICTYNELDSNFYQLSEGLRKNVFEHSFKAKAIKEEEYINFDSHVYGTTFEVKGNVALNYLFYLSDSNNHFFTGKLLFSTRPNYDSLQPVIDFIRLDIEHLIESFKWKNNR